MRCELLQQNSLTDQTITIVNINIHGGLGVSLYYLMGEFYY